MMYITIPLIITAYLYADRFTIAGMGEEFPPIWGSITGRW